MHTAMHTAMHIRHCATAAALALTLVSAQADTITYSSSQPLTANDWSSFLDLQQFDMALGTLQSVNVSLSSSLVGSFAAENRNNAPITISLGLTSTVTLLIPGEGVGTSLQVAHAASRTFNAARWDGAKDFGGTSGFRDAEVLREASISRTFESDSMLQLFTGTGFVTTRVGAVGQSSRQGTGAYFTEFGNRTSALASVTYTYDKPTPVFVEPALQLQPVPEPGTWALMLAGLGAVGWLAKRRNA